MAKDVDIYICDDCGRKFASGQKRDDHYMSSACPVYCKRHKTKTPHQYMIDHLRPLMGSRVLRIVVSDEPICGEDVYGLKFGNGCVAWIMRDPEGNGPGHLSVEVPDERGVLQPR